MPRQFPEFQPLVRKMTNWQRNQWARRGYPVDRQSIEAMLKLKRRDAGK
jgi:hypothetical protein